MHGAEHEDGAVKAPFEVKVQDGSSENTAVTSTEFPLAVSPTRLTDCGLDIIGKDCPFTSKVPDAGGAVYVIVITCS